MKKIALVSALIAVFALAATSTSAQTNLRVRGTITAVEGDTMRVRARDGQDLALKLADNLTVAAAKAMTLADLKPGDYVGVTAVRSGDGAPMAREVHTIARTVPEGYGPWDLEPNSTMTNATIDAVVTGLSNQSVTLRYKGESQTIRVPDGTPVVTTVPADRSALVPGEYVFIAAQKDGDGKLTALRVQVSRGGVKPPQ